MVVRQPRAQVVHNRHAYLDAYRSIVFKQQQIHMIVSNADALEMNG